MKGNPFIARGLTGPKPNDRVMVRGKDSAGNQYEVMGSGMIRRAWVKPWKGKSERRKVIRQRRQARAAC